jgi:DNA-binding NtrC family response regulator
LGDLVARSMKMRAFVAALTTTAASEAGVLIEGETGCGKEVAAHALHAASTRRNGPFVTFDCNTPTAALANAQLFGHEKGAFTGAHEARPGLLEEAEGGILFIDDISELPLELQPLLLGVIERKRGRRLGSKSDRKYDVRIVVATSRNLGEEARARRFREDLYFRLAVVRLKVPPLRERAEDIPVLADRFARELGTSLAPEAIAPLVSHSWPGNVRELKNTVTRMVIHGASSALEKVTLSPRLLDEDGNLRSLPDVRKRAALEVEKEYLEAIFASTGENLSHAAELAGISRQALTELLQKHNLYRRRWVREK